MHLVQLVIGMQRKGKCDAENLNQKSILINQIDRIET